MENSDTNYDIELTSVKSIDASGQEYDSSSLFEIKSFSSAIPAGKDYNLYLTSAARDTLQYNSDDALNVWNREFVFNFKLTIPSKLPATVSKRNNFFSNNAPTLGLSLIHI